MQIVDALDEGPLLNYWGFSYGTVLGDTVAAMFPDRMGKVVLDGNVNPHDYYSGNDLEQATDSDACFEGFFTGCVAHPEMCALATNGSTADELKAQFYDFLYSLKFKPLVDQAGNATTLIDYSKLKTLVGQAMYAPNEWSGLARGLHGLYTSNQSEVAILEKFLAPDPTTFPPSSEDAISGIRGSDVVARTPELTSLYPLISQFFARSQLLGDQFPRTILAAAQWPFHAKGAYTGDFHVKTKNPILFVGSDVDIVTPLISAQNASAGFEGSVVLQHGGYGVSLHPLSTHQPIWAYLTQ